MPFAQREQTAIDQYLTFIANKEATVSMLNKRMGYVKRLSELLVNAPHSREAYQQAVEKLKLKYAKFTEQALDLFTHEFYAFWMNDTSSISVLRSYFCFDIETERSNLLLSDNNHSRLSQHSVNSYNQRQLYLF